MDRSTPTLAPRDQVRTALSRVDDVSFAEFAAWAREHGLTDVACELLRDGVIVVHPDGHIGLPRTGRRGVA